VRIDTFLTKQMIHKTALIALSFVFLTQNLIAQQSMPPTDRSSASRIEPKGTYVIEQFLGVGNDPAELAHFSCLQGENVTEKNSHWFLLDTKALQQLTFAIAALRVGDDLDFALYEQNQKDGSLQELRCSAQGRQLGNTLPNDQCLGVIGLSDVPVVATSVGKGCTIAQHFLTGITCQANSTYFLMVHNYSSAKGFSINFGQSESLSSSATPHNDSLSVGDVFPNPAQTEAFLPVTLPVAAQGELLLLRANGQIVSRQTLELSAGEQQLRLALPQQSNELLYVRLLLHGQVFHRKVVTLR
jgi:hypothetical protein